MKWLQRIALTLLCALTIGSTLSFSVHKHFCGPFLKDVSIIVPSKGCGMEQAQKATCAVTLKKSCCNDHSEHIQGQDDLKNHLTDYSITAPIYAAVVTPVLKLELELGTSQDTFIKKSNAPPLVRSHLYVAYQQFLI